jgi:hypothetical protein
MNNDTESLSNIINDNEGRYLSPKLSLVKKLPEEVVDHIADMLERKLAGTEGYTDSRGYFAKVARLLPSQTLERLADTAIEKGRYPGRYFTALTKHEIAKSGYATQPTDHAANNGRKRA